MYQRLMVAILCVFFAFGSSAAQKTAVHFDPIPANAPARSEMQAAKNLRLKGVLISSLSRTALVNGRAVQEGARIGGAEILVIEQHGIRVRVGAREFSINVGNNLVVEQSSINIANVSRKSARDHSTPRIGAHPPHEVKSGETLSGIALRYRKDGVTVDQMMIALYQSNPQAFNRNINVLHAGAVLRIPDGEALHRRSPAMAAAEVARHTDSWRPANHQPTRFADASHTRQYGPVESGKTLSAIASSVLYDSVTLDQMMIALYQSNPQAFSGNINMLHEGAVLTIPGENELRRQTRETATAEVVRQTKAWRKDFEQHALSTLEHTNIMAAADGLIDQMR